MASGAPLVCIWLEWRESRRGDALAGALGKLLVQLALAAVGIGAILGALAGAVLAWQFAGPYQAALARLPSHGAWLGIPARIWSAVMELLN